MYTDYNNLYSSYLYHSGTKGMKWGIRRKVRKMQKSTLKLNYSTVKGNI